MHALRSSIVLAAAWCTAAHAGSKTKIALDATGKCTHETVFADGDADTFDVTLSTAAPAALDVSVKRRVDGTVTIIKQATIAASSTSLAAPLSLAAKDSDTVQVGPNGARCQFVFLAPVVVTPPVAPTGPTPPAPSPPAPSPPAPPPVVPDIAADNERALAYLADKQITDHEKTGHRWGHTYRVYHLPDGSPAFPLPRDIAEEDHLEPWIVRISGQKPSLEITQCGDVPSVRISGTRPGAAETVNTPKSGEGRAADIALPPPLRLSRLSAPFTCATAAAYKVTTDRGAQDVSLTTAPVYMFSWGLAYGFDFGRPGRIALVDRAGEAGPEKVIVRTEERAGFRPMATLTWNACRANPKAWDACDAFGLTAMADLSHLTEGGGLGVKLQPYPGLGVLIGVTFFQVDTLRTGSGVRVGSVFAEPGELPIHKRFTKGSFGLFLGVGGDTATVKSLF